MVSYWDEAVGNITAAYKEKGMWENTLMVLTTEYAKPFPQKVFCNRRGVQQKVAWLCSNGGPTYWADGAWATWPPLVPGDAGPGYPHGGAANNWSAETPFVSKSRFPCG